MLQNDLQKLVQRIFGVKKVTYNAPNYDAPEQDCVFIEVLTSTSRVSEAQSKFIARVRGNLMVFSQDNRLPLDFFAKRIANAAPADVKNFCYQPEMDIPNSPARMINVHERRLPFLFLYDTDYDPDKGTLTSIVTN